MVTFVDNGADNGPFGSMQVRFDFAYDTITSLPVPTLAGFGFGGWWTEDGTGGNWGTRVLDTDIVAINDNHTLHAQWGANRYFVTYNANAPSNASGTVTGTMADTEHTFGIASPLRENAFALNGWTFLGWARSSTATTAEFADEDSITNLSNVEDDIVTLYAVWVANAFTVEYNPNAPSNASGTVTGTMADSHFTFDAAAMALRTNTFGLTGWTFLGWARSATATTAEFTDEELVRNLTNADGVRVTLYAVWAAIEMTVTFYYDGATSGNTVTNIQVRFDSRYDAISPLPIPGRIGFTFDGWWTMPAGAGGNRIENDTIVSRTTEHTLYARWTAMTFIVRYDPNRPANAYHNVTGTMANSTHSFAYNPLTDLLRDNDFRLHGWTFQGWATSAGSTMAPFGNRHQAQDLTVLTNGETINLFAVWQANQWTVTFDYRGATSGNAVPSISVRFDSTYNTLGVLPTPGKTGHQFNGWWTTPAIGGTQITGTSMVRIDDNHTLYARWIEDITTYSITFENLQGGTHNNPTTFSTDALPLSLEPATWPSSGFVFAGWFTELTGGVQINNIAAGTTGNQTVFARWTPIEFTVEYRGLQAGETYNNNPTVFNVTTPTVELRAPANVNRPGYAFRGWFTAPTGGERVTQIAQGTIGNIVLYARFELAYTVIFENLHGTEHDNSQTVFVGDDVNLTPPTTEREGYNFVGWYTELEGGTRITNTSQITGNMTLFARWEEAETESSFPWWIIAVGGGVGAAIAVAVWLAFLKKKVMGGR